VSQRYIGLLSRVPDCPAAVDVAWRRRSLLYLLLHPYSNLAWFMDVAPPPQQVRTLEELADCWFGV
jgi:hypothetical protein